MQTEPMGFVVLFETARRNAIWIAACGRLDLVIVVPFTFPDPVLHGLELPRGERDQRPVVLDRWGVWLPDRPADRIDGVLIPLQPVPRQQTEIELGRRHR